MLPRVLLVMRDGMLLRARSRVTGMLVEGGATLVAGGATFVVVILTRGVIALRLGGGSRLSML